MPRKDPLSAKLKKHSNCGKSCRRHHLIKLPKWCIVGNDLASALRTAWPSLCFSPVRQDSSSGTPHCVGISTLNSRIFVTWPAIRNFGVKWNRLTEIRRGESVAAATAAAVAANVEHVLNINIRVSVRKVLRTKRTMRKQYFSPTQLCGNSTYALTKLYTKIRPTLR